MASIPAPGHLQSPISAVVREFAAEHYASSGAPGFGMAAAALEQLLAEIATRWDESATASATRVFLESLHLEELVLARACAAGDNHAWEVFLVRYRATLYGAAYKIAGEESAARALADSLYAELYGVDDRGQQRACKLSYYTGRGSLQGWLRMVVAQEFVNRYRRTRRETSLDAELDAGKQFEAHTTEENAAADPRVERATAAELAEISGEERFLLAAYFLDERTLADIGKVLGQHESTISRKLDRVTAALRKRIRKRLLNEGMSPRQADEAMQDVDVRDLRLQVRETLRQERRSETFYPERGEQQG